jgi:membrane protease YdiL (CAAX protease family)
VRSSAAVLTFYPAYVLVSGTDLTLRSNWLWLAVGLFAYHGLAEELAWHGYAFRRLRRGRTFATAIRRTIPLIAITHLPIVITNGFAVGLFTIAVAAVTCLPFGYLWERGGETIWAAAMLHASIDAFKLFEIPGGEAGLVFSQWSASSCRWACWSSGTGSSVASRRQPGHRRAREHVSRSCSGVRPGRSRTRVVGPLLPCRWP